MNAKLYLRRDNPLLLLDVSGVKLSHFEACLYANRKAKGTDQELTVTLPLSRVRRRIDGKQHRASPRRFFKALNGYRLIPVDYQVGERSFSLIGTWDQVKETYDFLISFEPKEKIAADREALVRSLHTRPHSYVVTPSEALEIEGPSHEDILRTFDAGHRREAERIASTFRPQLRRTDCRDTNPLQNERSEVKAVLWAPYANYDLASAHMLAAGVPASSMPNYSSLASWLNLPRSAVKQYANQLIIQREPKGMSPWAQKHGLDKQTELGRQLGHLRACARPSAELQRWVRDRMAALIVVLKRDGYRVMSHEHDGLVLDREVPESQLRALLAEAGFPEHVAFVRKEFA